MKKRLLEKINNRVIIIILVIIIFSCGVFILYGTSFKDLLITSSYSTMSHKYIADILYSDKDIDDVLNRNAVLESSEVSNPDLIKVNNKKGYKLVKIKGSTYNGFLVLIYDSSKVFLATSKDLGKSGEFITSVSKREKAIIAINGGGFYDPNWSSNGSLAHGTIIKNGKIISDYQDAFRYGGFIGFTKDNKLVLGKMSNEEALKIGYRDAIEFGPFLIINGKKTKIKGNGGFGIAPRTAIGQRKDGTVMFLVINGRIPTSIGADMNDLYDIMSKYGAYNAANLDGGSSSELLINNKIINTPVAGGKNGLRSMSTFWIVKK
ncbi:MAG: phosphodiester glycosidase family protein [Firmicutes bacterium]|nr:phosphodiester glycosidase family protein [Bacillota bacterium]